MKHFARTTAIALVLLQAPLLSTGRSTPAEGAQDLDEDSRAYVISSSRQFGVANLDTGAFTLVGFTSEPLSGLGSGPRGRLYGLDAENNLITIDPVTASTAVIGNTGLPVAPDENVSLFTSLGSRLFALDPVNNLYSISRSTGRARLVGFTGIAAPDFVTCNCVTANSLVGAEGRLYFTWQVVDLSTGRSTTPSTLYRINPEAAVAKKVGPTRATAPIVGSGFVDGTLYGFTFGEPVNQPNEILEIDIETGRAKVVAGQAPSLDAVFGATRLGSKRSRGKA